jgi:hypothetical protein
MADFIYNADGRAQGFRVGSNIYALDGTAVGRVWAERAYRFDGSYVGALFKNMVVDKPSVSKRNLPPIRRPADIEPAISAETRRPVIQEFPDVFHLLLDQANEPLEEESTSAAPAPAHEETSGDFF